MTMEHRQLLAEFREAMLDDVEYVMDILNAVNNPSSVSDTQRRWKASRHPRHRSLCLL
jgi:hypothetical protein